MGALNSTQRKLITEIEEIRGLAGAQYEQIVDPNTRKIFEKESITPFLHVIKSTIVTGEVIKQATLDEFFLDSIIIKKILGPKVKYSSKRAIKFRSMFLDNLTFQDKFDYFKIIEKNQPRVVNGLKSIQKCRNVLAHSFFIERKEQKAIYDGSLDIFSPRGFKKFTEDCEKINRYFSKKLFGINDPYASSK